MEAFEKGKWTFGFIGDHAADEFDESRFMGEATEEEEQEVKCVCVISEQPSRAQGGCYSLQKLSCRRGHAT